MSFLTGEPNVDGDALFTQLLGPQDAVPLESALDRLLRARVTCDEQLMDYELSQALRGLFIAAKNPQRTHPLPVPQQQHLHENSGKYCYGREALLYRMSMTAVADVRCLPTVVYLSTRLLCDAASAYGEGNARPCCTAEWTAALSGAAFTTPGGGRDAFSTHMSVNRRFQLGYYHVVAGTLRSVASGGVSTHRLFSDLAPLVKAIMRDAIPACSIVAEGKADAATAEGAAMPGPSRLTVESNNFIIHSAYWLCVDVLDVHLGDTSRAGKNKVTVLDRDTPRELWGCVTRVRAALLRGFGWIRNEVTAHLRTLRDEQEREKREQVERLSRNAIGEDNAASGTVVGGQARRARARRKASPALHASFALLDAAQKQVDSLLTELLSRQERLSFSRASAVAQYGESAKDVHRVDDAMWGATVRLCLVLQNVAGAWVTALGGLALGQTTSGVVAGTPKALLMYIASCLTRLPPQSNAGSTESESTVLPATDALLASVVALAAATPVSFLQAELWGADGCARITREIHGALTQRGLRCRDDRVLQLVSLLMTSIMNTSDGEEAAWAGVGAAPPLAIAAETTDQLLEMLSESRDSASHVITGLLTSAVVQRPHVLIPALFRLLQHGSATARRSAMDVLAALPAVVKSPGGNEVSEEDREKGRDCSPLPVVVVPDATLRQTLRLLAEQLLLQLQDEELFARMQSAALFAKVWPEDVVCPLLNLCLQRDPTGKRQSAAKAALVSVLAAHSDSADVVLLLLQEALAILFPDKPGEGAGSITDKAGAATIPSTEEGEAARIAIVAWPAKAVPLSPADIFARAMLYSSSAVGEAEDDGPSPPEDAMDTASPPSAAATPSSAAVKAERLNSLVAALCRSWSGAAMATTAGRPHVSAEDHVAPLLLFVKALTDHEAQQFYLRHVNGALASLSSLSAQEEGGGHTAATPGQRAVIQAIHSVLLSPKRGGTSWLETVAQFAAPGAEPSETAVYGLLLPLLCLRACDRAVFASPLEPAESDADAVAETVRVLQAALFDAPYRDFFLGRNDLQRVLIEDACKVPPAVHLAQIDVRLSKLRPVSLVDPEAFFLARVSVFSVSFYLSTLPWGHSADSPLTARDASSSIGSLADCSRRIAGIVAQLEELGSSSRAASLCRPAIDAAALVTLCSLYRKDGPAFEAIGKATHEPLVRLDTTNRMRIEESKAIISPSLPAPPLTREEHAADTCIEVLVRTLAMAQAHPSAALLLRAWLAAYLQPLVALANSSCVTHAPPPYTMALRSGELIFRAVVLSGKLSLGGGSAAAPATTTTTPRVSITGAGKDASSAAAAGSASLLSHLGRTDMHALVSFGLGCARFPRSMQIQQIGVRVTAALLGAAPDALVDMDPSPVEEIFAVLRRAAVMHEDPVARQVAEQVLTRLFPAGAGE